MAYIKLLAHTTIHTNGAKASVLLSCQADISAVKNGPKVAEPPQAVVILALEKTGSGAWIQGYKLPKHAIGFSVKKIIDHFNDTFTL